MRSKNLGRYICVFVGFVSVGIGIFFIYFRPPLLPEDLVFIGIDQNIEHLVPRLGEWLKNVFTVLGGFIAAVGILKLSLARVLQSSISLVSWFVAWLFSSALMSFINFKISSNFKWQLFSLAIIELVGICAVWISMRTKNGMINGKY